MANKKYRKHSQEFKDEAVRLVLEDEERKSDVARKLSIAPSILDLWIQKYKDSKDPVKLSKSAESKRIAELERELKRVTEERDILKKAAIFFAKE